MKFVDEASIRVEAGRGGAGCLSFLRARNLAKGGPDGGNGGDGGDVILQAETALNTLVDFRYQPRYKAEVGQGGAGRDMTGRRGADAVVRVPVGTTVIDEETRETLGDLTSEGQRLIVARGGRHGVGNAAFKSSTNRAPRRTTPGEPGEKRQLLLQLKLIADVGLLGQPNAGKSTFIASVSAARPKIADYPFTTLVPNLGVVRVGEGRSFVVADVPGLIEGAADGAGLGIRFLKHLARTRLLLHLVDAAPVTGSDPVRDVAVIVAELERFSTSIASLERWVVVNKIDLLPEAERAAWLDDFRQRLGSDVPVFAVSAASGEGTQVLLQRVGERLAQLRDLELADDEHAAAQRVLRAAIDADLAGEALQRRDQRSATAADADASDDDDGDVEVHYVP